MTSSKHDDVPHTIKGLDPIVGKEPSVLILGSMPGVQSLAAQSYYIHPRNAFWAIMAELNLCQPDVNYKSRIDQLKLAGVALWDSLHSCEREGSLDTDINTSTEAANDFGAFFATHPTIRAVFFNGAKAEQAFRRHVLSTLSRQTIQRIAFSRLPSTSPAHAIPLAEKVAQWHSILREL